MDELTQKHLENRSAEEIFDMIVRQSEGKARDLIMFTKLLISQAGKEKAKELIYQARYDMFYKMGREAAEKSGNPHDIDSFAEAFLEWMGTIKWVPTPTFQEKTSTSVGGYVTNECPGKALARLADDETREIFKEAYCIHDIAWAKGFNPRIEARNTSSYFDKEDRCGWVWEIK